MKNPERVLDRFVARHVVPLADATAQSGKPWFPLGPDSAAESYYERSGASHGAPAGRPAIRPFHVEELAESLSAMWEEQGAAALKPLAHPLARLASKLRHAAPARGDVSPFVYEMF